MFFEGSAIQVHACFLVVVAAHVGDCRDLISNVQQRSVNLFSFTYTAGCPAACEVDMCGPRWRHGSYSGYIRNQSKVSVMPVQFR